MPHQHISPREPSLSYPSFRTVLLTKLPSSLFYIFLTITALAIFIPLNPDMPSKGLDPSWQFAMNEAVARHLSFGKEIIFPYGPYASIDTRSYHPATDQRMMCGSLLLAMSYVAALLFLARGRKRYLMLILLLFLATFGVTEILLLSYPFLLVVCFLKQMNSDDLDKATALSCWQVLAVAVMLSTLGLLPLVKGIFLLPVGASVAIPSAFLVYRARFRQALLLLLIPIAATAALWAIAGQSLVNFPAFLRGTILLTSGYTEAMATSWEVWPNMIGYGFVIVYLTVSALIGLSVCRSGQLTIASKWMLGLLCAVFLLVAFKHGFVRADHLLIAFISLAVFILIIGFLYTDRYLIWSLSIVMILISIISVRHDPVLSKEVIERFGVRTASGGRRQREILAFYSERAIGVFSRVTYKSTWNTYSGVWEGLRLRVSPSNGLEDRFVRAIANIRNDYALPELKGTTDIYSYEQSALIASNNEWNPRPICQSYSAYTPVLARLNEQHLRGPDAPDWVLFKLQSIDERLPSLDDGLSWPALFDNYTFISYDGQVVVMRKNQFLHANSNYDEVYKQTYRTGATVTLPETGGLLFAEVELKPTLVGRVLIALFRPPQLHIVLGLGEGRTRSYRVVANMIRTGFLVSPFVSNTSEFASLAGRSRSSLDEGKVESISIVPSYGGAVFWSGTYLLTLKRYNGELGQESSMLSKSSGPQREP
jgi:hypothetical protein